MPPAAPHKQGVKSWGNQPNQKLTPFLRERHFSPHWNSTKTSWWNIWSFGVFFKEQGKKRKKPNLKNPNPCTSGFLRGAKAGAYYIYISNCLGLQGSTWELLGWKSPFIKNLGMREWWLGRSVGVWRWRRQLGAEMSLPSGRAWQCLPWEQLLWTRWKYHHGLQAGSETAESCAPQNPTAL